jgi:hypothetical protein
MKNYDEVPYEDLQYLECSNCYSEVEIHDYIWGTNIICPVCSLPIDDDLQIELMDLLEKEG